MTRLNRKRISVLWIEDGAAVEVPHQTSPLINSGRYNLMIAKDATEGIRVLKDPVQQFDVVIFDLHLAPGDDEELIRRYQAAAQRYEPGDSIGMSILIDLFDPSDNERHRVIDLPSWLTPNHVGLLTVEPGSNVIDKLQAMGIAASFYVKKDADLPDTALKDLVDRIYRHRSDSELSEDR
jgi:hypothetical protein